MTHLYALFVAPFADFGFMRRALVACLALGLGSGPIGILLMLRRMSLVGDAMSHAVLPGAAIGFPCLRPVSARHGHWWPHRWPRRRAPVGPRQPHDDAARGCELSPAFYLTSLALGVLIVSLRGSSIDLLHVLFGSILAIDTPALVLVSAIVTITVVALALIYRPLVAECFDPGYLRAVSGRGSLYHQLFSAACRPQPRRRVSGVGHVDGRRLDDAAGSGGAALGAEVCRPLSASRSVARSLPAMSGLLVSFHAGFASGPTIILVASLLYLLSLVFAPSGVMRRLLPQRHFAKRPIGG